MSEVFPDTQFAIYALVAELLDGRFAVWAELKASRQACSPAETFATEAEARAEQERLIPDLVYCSYPDAIA